MALIEWSDKYSVGIHSIDEQHKIWIGLINKLHEAMRQGDSHNVLKSVLAEVVSYTKTHLSHEEKLFAQYNYPESAAHIAIHKKFTDQILEYQKEQSDNKTMLSLEVMNVLRNWLIDHITNTDKKYSQFFISKGLK